MAKTLFSLHLDDDLKIQATNRAQLERRSLANLIETAVELYVNPKPIGARVTVRITPSKVKLPKNSPFGHFTARVREVDPEKGILVLDAIDPITGRNEFNLEDIELIHLI